MQIDTAAIHNFFTTVTTIPQADPVTNAEEIVEFQQLVRMVPIGESVARHAVELVRVTRSGGHRDPLH